MGSGKRTMVKEIKFDRMRKVDTSPEAEEKKLSLIRKYVALWFFHFLSAVFFLIFCSLVNVEYGKGGELSAPEDDDLPSSRLGDSFIYWPLFIFANVLGPISSGFPDHFWY